ELVADVAQRLVYGPRKSEVRTIAAKYDAWTSKQRSHVASIARSVVDDDNGQLRIILSDRFETAGQVIPAVEIDHDDATGRHRQSCSIEADCGGYLSRKSK